MKAVVNKFTWGKRIVITYSKMDIVAVNTKVKDLRFISRLISENFWSVLCNGHSTSQMFSERVKETFLRLWYTARVCLHHVSKKDLTWNGCSYKEGLNRVTYKSNWGEVQESFMKKKWCDKGIRRNCLLFLKTQEWSSTNEEISSRFKPKGNSSSHSTSLNCGAICHRMLWRPKV